MPADHSGVAVHVLEANELPAAGRIELIIYPLIIQLNGKFTQHPGTMGSIIWHLHERFALRVLGGGNWYSEESAFNRQLAERTGIQVQQATSLLWTWGVMAGIEVSPAYGKFAILEDAVVRFDVVLDVAAGWGGTRHLLTPSSSKGPASSGDTGSRFLGALGAGVRLRIRRRLWVRLELTDVVYAARVTTVNGCSAA